MVPETFYQTVAQLSFTLLGLWWLVLQTKYDEWIHHRIRRRMATNITLYFLLPGSMSLLALLATNSRLLWQIAFILAAIIGAATTAFFLRDARASQWRNPWSIRIIHIASGVGLALYALVIVVALLPDAIRSLGVAPLTVAGIGVTLLVIVGVTLAWTYFIEPFAPARSPGP
ncbi:MAG TPA: hypothetical protein VFN11_03435 [Ktedonobacterales bacterium]|nr:hypothetical protein [Ktedonobacterales bacterium]